MSGQQSPQRTTPDPLGSGHAPPKVTGTRGPVGSAGSKAAGGGAAPDGKADNSSKYAALRVGWMMAEARGNLLRMGKAPGGLPQGFPTLPLDAAGERTSCEQAVEAVKVLASLATQSGLDLEVSTLTMPTERPKTSETTASGLLRLLTWRHLRALNWKGLGPTLGLAADEANDSVNLGAEEAREQLEGFLWAWDEAIQDELAAQEYGTSSSYQLGRGLAEIYWALDPDARSGPESWKKLLGGERATALRLLLDRLSLTVLPSVSASAIEFALGKWEQFAKDLLDSWEADEKDGNQAFRAEAAKDLKIQVKKWKDLLLMAADSTDFGDLGTIVDAFVEQPAYLRFLPAGDRRRRGYVRCSRGLPVLPRLFWNELPSTPVGAERARAHRQRRRGDHQVVQPGRDESRACGDRSRRGEKGVHARPAADPEEPGQPGGGTGGLIVGGQVEAVCQWRPPSVVRSRTRDPLGG